MRQKIIERIVDELNDGGEINHVKRQLRQQARSTGQAVIIPLNGADVQVACPPCLVVLPSGRMLIGVVDAIPDYS